MAKAVKTDTFEDAYRSKAIDHLIAQITPDQQEETDYKMKLAAKIYAGMKRKEWTQTHFAEVVSQHVSVISKWLSGTHNFTVDTLITIQRALGIHLLDVEETKVKSILDVRLTLTSTTRFSEEELHKKIHEEGGMLATSIEQKFLVEG